MKRSGFISLLMASAVMLGLLTSCMDFSWLQNLKPTESTSEETTTEETTAETSETTATEETTTSEETSTEEEPTVSDETLATESEETSASAETSSSTSKPKTIGKTKVTNAYNKTINTKYLGKVSTKIPKITIEGVSTKSINSEIYNKFKKTVKKNKCAYSYYIGKTYVSILIDVYYDDGTDKQESFVYNVSRRTGKKLSKADFLKELGVKQSTFESKAKKSLTDYWKMSGLDQMDNALYKKAVNKTSISKLIPFVNKKGKLSYLSKGMEIPSGIKVVDYSAAC